MRCAVLLALAIWLIGGDPLRASEIVGAVEVGDLAATSATLRWHTDTPAGTRVRYGLAPGQLLQSAEGGVTDLHAVALSGLQPGTQYFFAVGTARKQLATGSFTTGGANGAVAPATPVPKPRSVLAKIFSTAPPAPASTAPPARDTWGNPVSLPDHFARHGADFHARDAEDYARQAWAFGQRAKAGGLLLKIDTDGVRRVFDPQTGAFGAFNADGTTKTFFKPNSRDYFERQPGRLVNPLWLR